MLYPKKPKEKKWHRKEYLNMVDRLYNDSDKRNKNSRDGFINVKMI